MCGVLVSKHFVSFRGLKNEAYTRVLSVSLFCVWRACFAGLSSRFLALACQSRIRARGTQGFKNELCYAREN